MAVSGHRDMSVAQKYIEEAFERPELADAAFGKVRTKRDGVYTNKALPLHKHPAKPLKKQRSLGVVSFEPSTEGLRAPQFR
jgi:hypothetical protein